MSLVKAYQKSSSYLHPLKNDGVRRFAGLKSTLLMSHAIPNHCIKYLDFFVLNYTY